MKSSKKQFRIALTGPESTGKTTLAEQLSAHFGTLWVPEYAREYLAERTNHYEKEEVVKMAKIQLSKINNQIYDNNRIIFFDTDLIVFKIWYEYKYGFASSDINDYLAAQNIDYHLLCAPDLPWEFDVLRETPQERQILFGLYENQLKINKFPYSIIWGIGAKRVENAIKIVEKLLG